MNAPTVLFLVSEGSLRRAEQQFMRGAEVRGRGYTHVGHSKQQLLWCVMEWLTRPQLESSCDGRSGRREVYRVSGPWGREKRRTRSRQGNCRRIATPFSPVHSHRLAHGAQPAVDTTPTSSCTSWGCQGVRRTAVPCAHTHEHCATTPPGQGARAAGKRKGKRES